MTKLKNQKMFLPLAALSALALAGSASAVTTFTGGALGTAGNWTGGLPDGDVPLNAVGTIAVAGLSGAHNVSGWNAATINHTAGAITGADFNLNGNTDLTWNISSTASYSSMGVFLANGLTVNMSGGSMTLTNGSFGLGATNGATFNMSGGTVASTASQLTKSFNNGSLSGFMNLSGGSITSSSTTANKAFHATHDVDISGSFIGTALAATSLGADSFGSLNFASTGTWQLNLAAATDWSAQLIDSGATVDGNDITALNVGLFDISGGSISAVPEPSSTALLGLGGLALILRRRK